MKSINDKGTLDYLSKTPKCDTAKATSNQKSITPLSAAEQQHLEECEAVIEKGIKSFLDVAEALLIVCEKKLYRATHQTFQEYCADRWKITARHANRLMLAGDVVNTIKSDQLVSTIPAALPLNEAQARPLESLSSEDRIKAARKVAKMTDLPTAKNFEDAAKEVTGKKAKEIKVNSTKDEVVEDRPRIKTYDISAEVKVEPVKISALKPDVNLVPMTIIAQTIKDIYNIYCNPNKSQEGMKMFGKLQRWVEAWVEWEAKQEAAK